MSEEENKPFAGKNTHYSYGRSSPDAFSQLVETYCAEIGRERVRPFLVPTQSSRNIRPLTIENKSELPSVSSKPIVPKISERKLPVKVDENDIYETEYQDLSGNKNTSPSGSVTSRKLEWDSLADIGYANEDKNKDSHRKELSTLERIALNPHRNSNLSIDFTQETKVKYTTSLGVPIAQSTPNSPINHETLKDIEDTPITSKPFVVSHKRKTFKTKKKHKTKGQNSRSSWKRNISCTVRVDISNSQSSLNSSNLQPKSSTDCIDTEKNTKESSKNELHVDNLSNTSQDICPPDQLSRTPSLISDQKYDIFENENISTPNNSDSNEHESLSVKSKLSSQISVITSTKDEENIDLSLTISSPDDNGNNIDLNDSVLSKANSFEFVPGDLYYEQKVHSTKNSTLTKVQNEIECNAELKNPLKDVKSSTTFSDKDLKINQGNLKTSTFPRARRNSTNIDSIYRLINLKYTDPTIKEKLLKKIIQLLSSGNISTENSSTSSKSDIQVEVIKKKINSEIQTDTDDILKKEVYIESIPEDANVQNPIINVEKLEPGNIEISLTDVEKPKCDSKTTHRFCQTSQNSSSSYSSSYEKYLKEKAREKLKKKEYIVKKMSNISTKKTPPNSDLSKQPTNLNETQKQLDKINNEILKLLILKFKLENKHEAKDIGKIVTMLLDQKSSRKNSDLEVSECKVIDNASPESVSKILSTQRNDIDIPPLNLKMSSDEFSDNPDKSFQCSGKEKSNSSDKEKQSKTSCSHKKNNHIKKLADSCNCKINSCSYPCSYCESNKSRLDSNSSNKEPIEWKINRLKETYSKYQKCHIMKSFLNDYDSLIAKYQKLKTSPTEKETQSKSKSDSSLRQKSSVHESSISRKTISIKKSSTDILGTQSELSIPTPTNYTTENGSNKSKSSGDTNEKSKVVSNKNLSPQIPTNSNRESTSIVKPEISKNLSPQILTNSNRESISTIKPEISNSVAKEIFSIMEKIQNQLQQNNLNERLEPLKVDAAIQISTSSIESDPYDSKKILQEPQQSSKTSENKIDSRINREKRNKKPKDKNDTNICQCFNKHLKSQNLCLCCLKKLRRKSRKVYPKAIAYNLVLEPSNSVVVDFDLHKNKKVLDEIVVRVPRMSCKNKDGAIHQIKERVAAVTQLYFDSLESTDEQLREFSSLNDDSLSDHFNLTVENITPLSSRCISAGKENSTPNVLKGHTRKNMLSVKDYLKMNRPKFVNDANNRQESLKKNNLLRKQYEQKKREILEHNLSDFTKLKKNHLLCLQNLKCDNIIPENRRLFDAKEIVKKTSLRYKKLPEVKRQKELLKKQRQKKANKLIADIFVKKLQQRTLKGMVNISHASNVISL